MRWLEAARSLPPGGSTRIDHECGGGRTQKVSHDERGYSAYCFRCGETEWEPHKGESLQEKLARLATRRVADGLGQRGKGVLTPKVLCPREWPDTPRVWLYKAGMGNAEIRRLGIYYHERTGRVVLPCGGGYWQARGFDPDLPKYLNPLIDKAGVMPTFGEGRSLVLTEDYLSAWRVSKAGVTGASILGTKLDQKQELKVLEWPGPVVVWLDGDGAGVRGAAGVVKKLSLYREIINATARGVLDPKLWTIESIKEKLQCVS